jgi:2-amino-4-hydroxy-6-hydroxymethyldihydropteridine diphosphokinase
MQAWVGLGSNLGSSQETVRQAIHALEWDRDIELTACSSFYRTPPWGDTDQPDFINAVVRLETNLFAKELMGRLLEVESALGRIRKERRWGPRAIDLDLLLFQDLVMATPELTLPHPRMHERAFVLAPLLEIDPQIRIPGHGSASSCLAALDGLKGQCIGQGYPASDA